MSTDKLFVSGASGYVGRNLLRHLIPKGYRVQALVRTADAAALVEDMGAEPVVGDLLTTDFARVMPGSHTLIHAAADVDHRNTSPQQYAINVDGTRRIMEGAKAAGLQRAILLSTDSVLQEGRAIVDATENYPYPTTYPGMYSYTKALAEQLSLKLNDEDFTVIALRPRMVWGRDDTTGLSQLTQAVRDGKFAWISGGNYNNSTTHIGNLCHAIELALTHGRGGQVYHVSDGEVLTFREMVTSLLKTQNLEPPDRSVPRELLRMIAKTGDTLFRWSKGRIRSPVTFQEFATTANEITLNTVKAHDELMYIPPISVQQGLGEISDD